jgi:cell division protein ZapA
MAQVTLRINGYAYMIGCKDGEERHLEAMGDEVGRRIDSLRLGPGPSSEARMLVMAALLMADDIFEMRKKLAAAATATEPDPDLSRKLTEMALRAEEIAAGLETQEAGGAVSEE